MTSCELNEIFLGEVASVQNYGAFVRIPGCKQQGLIHKSQVSSSRVDDVADVLRKGERVWCKVINVGDDGKVGLSMKHVNQGNGTDLDPNGAGQRMDEQRRRKMVPGGKRVIELEAVLDTTCSKCGTRGHLAKDCFATPDGKRYDLLPEETIEPPPNDDTSVTVPSSSPKKPKRKKRSRKSKKRSDDVTDDDSEDDDESGERKRKRRMKKKSKESSGRGKRGRSDSSDGTGNRETKGRRESNEKKSKKCKHSRSKRLD